MDENNRSMNFAQRLTFLLNGVKINLASKLLFKKSQLIEDNLFKYQQESKWSIAKFHFENNEIYKSKFNSDKLPTNWGDLPIMEKTDFQLPLSETLSNGYLKNSVYYNKTSGSTGHPMYFSRDKECHALIWAYVAKRYQELGIPVGSKMAWFYGIPKETLPRLKERIKDFFMNRYRFSIYDLSDEKLKEIYFKIYKGNYKGLYGYTGSIAYFSKFILENKLNEVFPISFFTAVLLTSEYCSKEDRSSIQKAFNAPVYSEYGSSEFGYIGYDIGHNNWRIANENVFAEIIPKNNLSLEKYGGKILITDFNNKSFPFVRFNIGDIGKIRHANESRNFDLLYDLQGRENDMVILPSGKTVPGLVFYYISKAIIDNASDIRQYIVRQNSLNEFDFIVDSDKALSEHVEEDVRKKIEEYLEPDLSISFIYDESIEKTAQGKIKHFFSNVK